MHVLSHCLTASKLFLASAAVTVAGDWLLFGHGPGLGTAVFFAFLWLTLKWNRPATPKQWFLWGLLVASAVQCAIEPGTANTLVLVTLTAYVSAHWLHGQLVATRWRLVLEGLLSSLRLPVTFASLKFGFQAAQQTVESDQFRNSLLRLATALRVVWPVLLVAIPFVILLGGGNAILENTVAQGVDALLTALHEFEPPSFGRSIFWIGLGLLSLGLLSSSPLTHWLGQLESRLPDHFRLPTDQHIATCRTWLLLIVVNAIFFFANTADAWFLWLNAELPEGVNFSDFVHQGVHRLIACVLLAAIVLSIVFHQAKEIVQARSVKALAYVWIAQNLFLVASVVLRLKMYIDAYQLTLLRLHVLSFLLLVTAGFVLLAIKIHRDHGFAWLLNANVLAVFWLFFIVQFANDRGLVAWVNYRTALNPTRTQVIDIDYLAALGAPAWPTLERIANDTMRFPFSSPRAAERLAEAQARELSLNDRWQSWQWRRWNARKHLASGAP